MKCLDNDQIYLYIEGELSPEKQAPFKPISPGVRNVHKQFKSSLFFSMLQKASRLWKSLQILLNKPWK